MSVWSRLRRKKEDPKDEERSIASINDYISALVTHGGIGMIEQTGTLKSERVGPDYVSLSLGAFRANPVVFACMDVRQKVFSAGRFRFQQIRDGKPADYFGTRELSILERPWPGGTTQDLLTRVLADADIAGNSFWIRDGAELVRLRPDWVHIAVEERRVNGGHVGYRKLGYVYYEGGKGSGKDGVAFHVDEVAHFMPIPDPLASFRGMSWLTPVIREIVADKTMTEHKARLMENGATPNMIITHPVGADRDKVLAWAKRLEAQSAGVENAGKTLNLYPGADATVVGANLQQLDFKKVQGAGETRIAAAGGVPPVIVGLSEGLEAATYSNYGQARRRFADGTMHPLWQNVAGSFEVIVPPPGPGTRLAIDPTDVPFLREDEGDAANIAQTQAATISSLITAGYEPDSVVKAVEANDFRLLVHTGLYSVQLQPAGAPTPPAPAAEGITDE